MSIGCCCTVKAEFNSALKVLNGVTSIVLPGVCIQRQWTHNRADHVFRRHEDEVRCVMGPLTVHASLQGFEWCQAAWYVHVPIS